MLTQLTQYQLHEGKKINRGNLEKTKNIFLPGKSPQIAI